MSYSTRYRIILIAAVFILALLRALGDSDGSWAAAGGSRGTDALMETWGWALLQAIAISIIGWFGVKYLFRKDWEKPQAPPPA